jgi:hypothetical protein
MELLEAVFSIGSVPSLGECEGVVFMVGCGSRQTARIGAAEHGSRGIYINGCRYQAATSEDLKGLELCYSEKSNE